MTMQPYGQQPPPPPMPPGWYPAAPGVERWWDGFRWTDHMRAVQPTATAAQQVVIETNPYRSVSKTHKNTSHTFHLIMTLLTAGMWAIFVWFPIIIWHALGPRRRTVTRYH